MNYNKVILMGHITRDIELQYLQSGTAVAKFGLATNEVYIDKQTQEKKENAHFFEIEAWARQAEIIQEYFSKGMPIFIEGSLKQERWETPEGEKRSRIVVRAFRIQFLTKKEDNGNGTTEQYPRDEQPGQPTQQLGQSAITGPATSGSEVGLGDDIPF